MIKIMIRTSHVKKRDGVLWISRPKQKDCVVRGCGCEGILYVKVLKEKTL